jgi:hypothetical protein
MGELQEMGGEGSKTKEVPPEGFPIPTRPGGEDGQSREYRPLLDAGKCRNQIPSRNQTSHALTAASEIHF